MMRSRVDDDDVGELRAVTRAYVRQVRALSCRELRAHQAAPWASIGYGAAGIATALWRDGRGARDHARAQAWLAAAARGGPGAFRMDGFGDRSMEGSLYYGADGVHLLRVLLRGGTRPHAFLARCRLRRGGPAELAEGIAGTLTALVLLHRRISAPAVRAVADELAADLLVRADGPDGWTRGPNLGFAHGRAGIFHALLSWSIACGRALPTAFARHLDRLAADVERTGTMGAPRAQLPGQGAALARSWCNGAAGLALLWARAYEHAPRAAYLGRARAAATFVLDEVAGAPGHLCCGLAGRAYALLAMERIEPGRWIARAEAMAAAATTAVLAQRSAWPNGLLTGYPGLVCLARELDAAPADRIGFPLVEGA